MTGPTVAGLTAAAAATRSAVDRRVPAIYQAAMFDGRFLGFADFLVHRCFREGSMVHIMYTIDGEPYLPDLQRHGPQAVEAERTDPDDDAARAEVALEALQHGF